MDSRNFKAELYPGTLGEAWPSTARGFVRDQVGQVILNYLGGDVDDNTQRYSSDHLAQFSLFGINASNLFPARLAIEEMLAGDFVKAEIRVAKDPSILLQPIAEVKDRHGRTLINTNLFRATVAA